MTNTMRRYRRVDDDDDDDRLVYDLAFTRFEISTLLDALKELKPSEELRYMIQRLEWCFHSPGRRPE